MIDGSRPWADGRTAEPVAADKTFTQERNAVKGPVLSSGFLSSLMQLTSLLGGRDRVVLKDLSSSSRSLAYLPTLNSKRRLEPSQYRSCGTRRALYVGRQSSDGARLRGEATLVLGDEQRLERRVAIARSRSTSMRSAPPRQHVLAALAVALVDVQGG